MSIRVNVCMSKIMCTPIKVGVRTREVSQLSTPDTDPEIIMSTIFADLIYVSSLVIYLQT